MRLPALCHASDVMLWFSPDVTYLIKVVKGGEPHARNESIRTNEFVFQ